MLPLLNGRLVERLRKLFNLHRTYNEEPVVNPVVVINDREHSADTLIIRSATATSTLYSVPNDPTRKFYIDAVALSGVHSALSTVVNTITMTHDGATQIIAQVNLGYADALLEKTPSNAQVSVSFPVPLEVDINTNITCAIGSSAGRAIIFGHFDHTY